MGVKMDFLQAVIDANVEIYNFFKENPHEKLCEKLDRGYGGDISIRADIEAENIFVKHLGRFGEIYSEESGKIGQGEDTIIIDPLDGSNNFKSKVPFYGTSVAKKRDGIVTHAIVANLPEGCLYIKTSDIFEKRSFISSEVKKITQNNHSAVGIFEKSHSLLSMNSFLKSASLKYRSMGALALSLSLSHEVNFVISKGNAREFDVAAGLYMCEDLFRFQNSKILLVSKDKVIFDKICGFVKEQYL